jgi:hypothetical protein
LVQDLHNAGKTGLLRLRSRAGEGEIYLAEGEVRHARVGDEAGEDAFYRLLTWAEGDFSFETGKREIEHQMSRSTMGLLMEGMRRLDESRKM